jgi:hypothetical protein
LWATKEAREGSAEFALAAGQKVAEESGEKIVSIRDYEIGHYLLSDDFPVHQ